MIKKVFNLKLQGKQYVIFVAILLGVLYRNVLAYRLVTFPLIAILYSDEIGTIPSEYWPSLNPLQFGFKFIPASTAGDLNIFAYDGNSVVFANAHWGNTLYDRVDVKSFQAFNSSGYGYAKDKNAVYYSYGISEHSFIANSMVVQDADPNTFIAADFITETMSFDGQDASYKFLKGKRYSDQELEALYKVEMLQRGEYEESYQRFLEAEKLSK